jgi:hypothetical protein
MFKIIGSDGNQYGPVSAQQIRAWISEGRANGQTMAQAEGATDWKKLGEFPEFSDLLTSPVPPLASGFSQPQRLAEDSVRGPATGLMVVAVIGFVMGAGALVMDLTGAGMNLSGIPGLDPNAEQFMHLFAGTFGIISAVVGVLLSAIIFWGGLKMKTLENYGLAMTASILALIPCLSPCCVLGLPLGIWALVVLMKPEVKAAFH